MNLRLRKTLSIGLCVTLSPLICKDIRNGFFIGGGFGAKNEVLSSYQDVSTLSGVGSYATLSNILSKYPDLLSVAKSGAIPLQETLNKDLQALVKGLEALNNEVAKVGVSNQSLKGLSQLDLPNTSNNQELEAKIETEIQALQSMINATTEKDTSVVQANQEIIQKYQQALNTLKGLGNSLLNEVNDYNKNLSSDKMVYQKAEATYKNGMNAYNSNVSTYTNARDNVLGDFKEAAKQNAGMAGVTKTYNDMYKLINADPHYKSGKQRIDYQIATNDGIDRVADAKALNQVIGEVKGINEEQNRAQAGEYFSKIFDGLLSDLHVGKKLENLTLLGLWGLETWFERQIKEIDKLGGPGYFPLNVNYLKQGLSDVYSTLFNTTQQLFTGNAYAEVIPTANSIFTPPTAPDDKFSFSYQDYSDQIKNADPKMANIQVTTGVPAQQSAPSAVHASLGSFVDTINGASKFYSNVGYNANVITGYQHFFSRRLGFSLQASAGYEWVQSPLFQKSPLFNRMQGARVALGGDLLYDFKAPATQSGLYCGLFAGLFGTNSHYFLTTKALQTYWKYSFNVHWNAGLRFQLGSNIVKLGVSSPLIPRVINLQAGSTHFLVHETFHNFNLYASYAVLFGD
ncbi:hypothetical protein ACFOPX_03210 [Helicobacter baculiformis]|uniref:OMP269 n=1 Tax=Helicobacter baculiformis TaxID=427351 RepID=A0A1M4NGP9_9HELI|nr:hypothetical protein [Helicobacter baculiformis]SFZ71383.1 OMP269 [Helicobacter baculiformis]